jgi:hypothetical protein
MPGIKWICHGVGCPSKHRCYLALAGPAPDRSWASYDEIRDDGNPCGFFWDVSEDDSAADNGFLLDGRKDD